MSDCSTNAFNVPACSEPKTCGGCCKTCKNGEHLLTIHCKVHHATIGGESRCYCGGEDYVKRTDTIEQRYERLADAAVELVWIIEAIRQPVDPVLTVKMARIRHELEALGVSLDD